ncbi:MAG: hypothetical protein KN64_02000 [Sulfurovum sp. AS07-7]|nr:MAG: hypothetical protein KN64_02000 [Sulfurovum sp. AS07-7]
MLANNFSKNNTVYIVTFSNEEPFYKLNQNINHIKLNLLKESKNKIESFKNSLYRLSILKKTLKEIDADINISFMIFTNLISVIASKLNRQKIVISERIVYDFYNSKTLYLLRKIIYPFADLLITQTYADKKNYTFMKNVEVIYNPLELPTTQKNREKIIFAVGRFEKQKGFDKLIEAFSKIDSIGWRLCIAGDGVEKENLQNQMERLNLSNVELIGKRKDIFEWYAKSSIFVLSSQKEGFPNVLLEAMGSGCACISFDCPNGPSEIIKNGINGILVENQNIEQLVFQMQRLVSDEDLRERFGSEAIKVKEKYSIEKIADEWKLLLEKIYKG